MTAIIGAHIGAKIGIAASNTHTSLSASLTDSVDPVNVNTNFTYSATITNTGTSSSVNIIAVIVVDGDLTPISAVGSGWAVVLSGNTFTCTRASLPPGNAPIITVTVTSSSVEDFVTSTLDVTSDNSDPATQASQNTTVLGAILSVTLTDSSDPVITTTNFNYSQIVTNIGSSTATSVSATVTLDSSLTFVSGSGTGWSVSAVGQVVTSTRATLAVGAAPTITITVTSGASATTVSSTGSATASNSFPSNNAIQVTTVNLVSRDATSHIFNPANSSEWTSFLSFIGLATGNPTSTWSFQESSGSLADSIGSVTLGATGSPSYQQSITGWSRKGVKAGDATSNKFTNNTTAPNSGTTDVLLMVYIFIPSSSPATSRDLFGMAAAADCRFNTTGKLRPVFGATSDLVNDPRGRTMPVLIKINNTGTVSALYTDQEKFIGTYATPANAILVFFGGQTANGSNSIYGYGAQFVGAAARLTDAQVKTLLQGLGWTIPWT